MIESKIQAKCIELAKDAGYMVFRNLEVTPIGTPDLTLLQGGYTIWVEIKQESGRLSPAQEFTHQKISEHGGEVHTVYSVEEFKELL